jgi:sortase B
MKDDELHTIDTGYDTEHNTEYDTEYEEELEGEWVEGYESPSYGRKKHISPLKVLQMIFIIGIVVCAIILGRQYLTRQKAKSIYNDLQNRSTEAVGTNNDEENTSATLVSDIMGNEQEDYLAELGVQVPEKSLDWAAMQAEYSDIYAWIYIPGTSVDYPVLQSSADDPDYYLKHNLDGSPGYPGAIYTQPVNSQDFTDFTTVLYGHDMKDGTMFKTLHNYSELAYLYNNNYIYIYTPEKVLVYRIFSAVTFGNGNVFLDYDMGSESGRTAYITALKSGSVVDTDVSVNIDSRIITLSTCIGSSGKNRWLVSGVLLEP